MWLAFALFVFSLAGIGGLLGLKGWELRHVRVIAPRLRERADEWALHFKELAFALQADLEKLPPELLHLSRSIVHELVLALAALLRFLSQEAHKLADMVSHKHSFKRRAPRSEFLQKVIEHKNGNGAGSEENSQQV